MTVYAARPIKRIRATRDEMEQRHEALLDITREMQPMTMRQGFYQAAEASERELLLAWAGDRGRAP
jgi:hypothetical protein